jgi:hypothetical protein
MRAAIKAIDPRNWSLLLSDIRALEEVRKEGVVGVSVQGVSRGREQWRERLESVRGMQIEMKTEIEWNFGIRMYQCIP